MSAPRAAAMVSTSQSMGSQLRPGVNIWWNSSVTPYRLDSAAATMGAHFDSSPMGLATSSAPAGPCGFKWKRSALHSAAPSTRYSLKCQTQTVMQLWRIYAGAVSTPMYWRSAARRAFCTRPASKITRTAYLSGATVRVLRKAAACVASHCLTTEKMPVPVSI